MLHSRFPYAGTVLLGAALPLVPATAATPPQLEETLVTASRTPQEPTRTLAATTVIDRDDIANSNAHGVQDLLEQRVPGLQMSNSGGAGKDSSVFLRGTNSDHVLVLVNGIKQNSATTGKAAFQHLPVEQIERIEVVRGPRSSLYGAEAVGGVIQIFTRQGEEGFHPHAEIGYGSHEHREASAGVRGGSADTRYSLGLDHVATEGIDALDGGNPDHDGYERTAASASLEQELWAGGEVGLDFMRAEGVTEYDSPSEPDADQEDEIVQQSAAATFRQSVGAVWDTRLRVGESRDESEILKDGERTDFHGTRRQEASWSNSLYVTDFQELVLGADFREDRLDYDLESGGEYAEDSRYNRAAFGQWLADWRPVEVGLGLRHDDNEAYGAHTTGNANLGFRLAERLKLVASYGTAFKAPTFNDLYWPDGRFGFFGNPDLKPEESRTAELGLEGRAGWGSWELRAFETRVEELIVNVDTNNDGWVDTPENLAEARIRGAELSADLHKGGWRVRPSVTYLEPEDEETGNQLPRRAKASGTLDVQKTWTDRWAFGGTVEAKGKRYDGVENTDEQEMPGYALLHLRGSRALGDAWRLEVEANNVLDKDYERVQGYNTHGREFFVSLSYGAH
ncbi:MAG: TonB-dependent receptor domain-containing protein [Thiohalorhabdus sp.]|uniref:TonB-dependent receptor domain-containing protein n=1 Tax=Thiohalorhabdus sp. TaxID=3094134 RepID=UPI00398050CA